MKTKLLCIVCVLVLVLTMVGCKQALPKPTNEEARKIAETSSIGMIMAAIQKENNNPPAGYNHTIDDTAGTITQSFNNCSVRYPVDATTVTIVITGTSKLTYDGRTIDSGDPISIDFSSVKVDDKTWSFKYISSPSEKAWINGYDVTAVII